MNARTIKRALYVTASALSFVSSVPVLAQAAQEDANYNPSSLGDIVVTARKREESVQTTPLSISAFGAQALQDRNVQSSADIANFVPNVQFDSAASESGGGASSQISIRGIGQTDYVITVEPAVGLYLDGVYVGKSVGSLLDTVDIERIEVLRGPQGTLFGKNTIGGAIQFISKRPSDKFEAEAEATVGRFNRIDVKGILSGPLSDKVRARLSGAYQSRDGFMDRVSPTGAKTGEQGNINRLSGRLVVEADLTENLMATLSFDGTRIREQSPAQVLLKVVETDGFAGIYNGAVPGGVCLPTAGAARFSNPFCYNSQYVRPIDSRTTTNSGPNKSDTDIKGAALNLEWKGDDITLRSITAYRDVGVSVAQDLYGSPYYFGGVEQEISQKQFSQEFQLLGDLMDSRLKYVAGLFYMHESGEQSFPVNLPLVQFVSGGKIRNDSYAAFGQLTYDLTDELSITGGLRYTHERKQFNPGLQVLTGYDYLATIPTPGVTNPIVDAFGPIGTPLFPAGWYKRTSKSATPMVSLSYKFDRDVMGYATFSQGFKAGGFTMRYFPAVMPAPGTDPDDVISYAGPEKATSYEVGLKTELFDRKLRLNVAGFYTDYKNIQVTYVVDPDGPGPIGQFVPVLANAGTAHLKGIEVEGSAALTDWFRFDGSFGYIDAKYVRFSADALANFPGALSLKIPNTSKFTYNIGGVATFLNNDSGTLFARADYSRRSGQFKEFANDPALFQSAYGVLGASVTYRTADKRWEVAVGGTNLTDKAYIVSGVTSSEYAQAVRSRPREWFLRLRHQY
ncbi:MAG: TonB-dependent receptor [Pseudomonadota bacterium]